MRGNRVRLDQGHVVDQKTQYSFALAHIDARVAPNPGKLLGEFQDVAAHLRVERNRLVRASSFMILDGVGMEPELLIPLGFERVGDETIIGVDLHVAPPREFSLVTRPLDMLTAQSIGLGGARLEFALDREADLQGHGRHQLDQKGADRWIDHLAGNRLADLASAADHGLLAKVDWDGPTLFPTVADAHCSPHKPQSTRPWSKAVPLLTGPDRRSAPKARALSAS